MDCLNCGNSIPEGKKFCTKCGAKVPVPAPIQNPVIPPRPQIQRQAPIPPPPQKQILEEEAPEEIPLSVRQGRHKKAVPQDYDEVDEREDAYVFDRKDWLTAFLLSSFLGMFGAHRFYTGYFVIGAIQLLTAGGFTIWWIYDAVMLFTGNFKDAQGKELYAFSGLRVRMGHVKKKRG